MKNRFFLFLFTLMACVCTQAQNSIETGSCGSNIEWTFDGRNLVLNIKKIKMEPSTMPDYDISNSAPWHKYKDKIKSLKIGADIGNIGACAFEGCSQLTEVVFEGSEMQSIGWGAFMGCTRLRNIIFPINLTTIGTLAFARCTSLMTIAIPDRCRVEEQAFVSCDRLVDIDVSPTAILCDQVFAREVVVDGQVRHSLYSGLVRRIPDYVNKSTSNKYGISPSVLPSKDTAAGAIDVDAITSEIDNVEGVAYMQRTDIVALVIGNQNYRFASPVTYALHDARVFAEYCEKVIGVPRNNIHIAEDATKQMILEEEMEWLESIEERSAKKLIVYYAGHGVPYTMESDNGEQEKMSYLLPVDVIGTHAQKGIALDDFYQRIGSMGYAQASVFIDACFSGLNRGNTGVVDGLRAVGERAPETQIQSGNIVAFAAAQEDQTAQGHDTEGHGLFTYCLLNALRKNPSRAFGPLFESVKEDVEAIAPQLRLRQNQTPVVTTSPNIAELWKNFYF